MVERGTGKVGDSLLHLENGVEMKMKIDNTVSCRVVSCGTGSQKVCDVYPQKIYPRPVKLRSRYGTAVFSS